MRAQPLELPAAEKRTFDVPVAVDRAPPPILRWKQRGSDWAGGARFFTERKISSYEIWCVEDGPASVAYAARYRFVPQGEYVWRVRVATGVPVAVVTEEFDFGEVTEGKDFLLQVMEDFKIMLDDIFAN